MTDASPTSPTPDSAAPGPLTTRADIEEAWQRQMTPFLQDVKKMTLDIIEEVGRKHGNPIVAQLRQTLTEVTAEALKTQAASLWAQLKPAMLEHSDAVRQKTDSVLDNLKQFIATTVVEMFRVHVPDYSRWAGQRVLDYVLAGTLFCLAAVLLCVGGILTLEQVGFPPYATYLVTGAVALAAGLIFLKVRSRPSRRGSKETEAKATGPSGRL